MNRGTRSWVSFVGTVAAVSAAPLLVAIGTAALSRAETCPQPACTDVLAQESRWLTAITNGDTATIDAVLAPDFFHITSKGELFDRARELANVKEEQFTMNPSEEIVTIDGDVAVIHGINTLIGYGAVLARERFTDVFVNRNGDWIALSAQETAL